MFGDSDSDKAATMKTMLTEAMQVACANRVEARAKVIEWAKRDRRFDNFDHDKLVDKVLEKSQYGGRLDWDDPELKRGGQPRPQNRRGMW